MEPGEKLQTYWPKGNRWKLRRLLRLAGQAGQLVEFPQFPGDYRDKQRWDRGIVNWKFRCLV